MLQRLAWVFAAILALLLLQSLYRQPVGWAPGVVAAGFALLAAFNPVAALSVLAAMVPLAGMLFFVIAPRIPVRYEEALALAFIAGWALNRAARPRRFQVSPALLWTTALMLALVLASTIVSGAIMVVEHPDSTAAAIFGPMIARNYLVATNSITTGVLFVEGLVLLIIAAETCGGDPAKRNAVLRMLVIGAAAAALFNVLRLVVVAVAREHPLQEFATLFLSSRVNVHHADLNAAGSYFGMMMLAACGLWSRARVLAVMGVVLPAVALWLTGSRAAMAAVVFVILAAGLVKLRGRSAVKKLQLALALAVVLAAVAGLWYAYPAGRNAAVGWSVDTRVRLADAALEMTAEEPLFGVGIGRYYALSNKYVGDMLAAQWRPKARENAHNYYLQVLAELGIPGLLLFLVMLGAALHATWRASDQFAPAQWLLAGSIAFLLTCVTGHPLLVAAVAYPFWILLGTCAARPGGASEGLSRWRLGALGALVVVLATVPLRVADAASMADLEHKGAGFSKWQIAPDGSRFRWAGGRSGFYVDSGAISVRIPLRHGGAIPEDIEVVVSLDGREANRIVLPASGEWRSLWVIPKQRPDAPPFSLIELEACAAGQPSPLAVEPTDTSGAILVGRPIIDF